MNKDQRYPYTYAVDLIREVAGMTESGTKLCRADASRILEIISSCLEHSYNITREDIAKEMANYFLSRVGYRDLT